MGEKDKGIQQHREQELVSHVPLLDQKMIECMVWRRINMMKLLVSTCVRISWRGRLRPWKCLIFIDKTC
jgi:hypothetical protein